jgi:hypothetical protein
MEERLPMHGAGPPRLWSLAEANAALPRVRELLAASRKALAALRDIEANLQDLRILWGDAVLSPSCPAHAEYLDLASRAHHARDELEARLLGFQALGCEVKDLDAGLIDFRTLLAEREVYLCWRDGEAAVGWWHPMETGIAGRRPVPGILSEDPSGA